MKLLFDQNLSSRLIILLKNLFPGSQHVRECGLKTATDSEIWEYAKKNGLVIVTKDSDFRDRSFLRGSPPKVIWLRTRNCATAHIEFLLRTASTVISRFIQQEGEGCLILGQRRENK